MLHFQPWIILLCAAIGNCGFWLFLFNRVNAAGLERKLTKRLEKLIVFACFALPIAIAILEWEPLLLWLNQPHWRLRGARFAIVWGTWCLASGIVLGVMWLESRRWLIPPPQLLSTYEVYHPIGNQLTGGSTVDQLTTLISKLPGNQITGAAVSQKELQLPRNIPNLDGFKIGHLSDLHFTGQFRVEHYQRVFDHFMELSPDLILITGDILDYDRFVPWIRPLLGRLSAPFGCTFLLGNHDLRLQNLDAMLGELQAIGHFDIGVRDQEIQVNDVLVSLTGNENPWFERHTTSEQTNTNEPALRIGLSHTPDQISWARKRKLDLLFAGHTHGGQARFPGIGPVLSPSRYGSKFASGVFYLSPTLMHVSRGVAGTHPFRWWCSPEVSLLTLRNRA
jgi:uncharacterized protein